MQRAGFTLLELLVSLAISAILAGILFSSYALINRFSYTVDTLADMTERAVIAMHQFEKDLMGAFIPVQGLTSQDKQASEDTKKLKKIFYGTQKNGMLDTLTFITNNVAQEYTDDAVGKTRPRIARVVYRLVEEKTVPVAIPSYALMRQEDYDLSYDAFAQDAQKPIRAYQLVGGIKKITVKYTATMIKKEKEGEQKKEYKVVDAWNLEEQKEMPDSEGRQVPIPFALDVELVLWDTHKQRDQQYIFKIMIMSDNETVGQEREKPVMPTQQPVQNMAAPAAATPAPAPVAQPKRAMSNTVSAVRGMFAKKTPSPNDVVQG